jgi:phosphatidylglycerophosphate synthase
METIAFKIMFSCYNLFMNLQAHASREMADRFYAPREEWNVWQRIADKTNDIGTPGNALTTVGTAGAVVASWAFLHDKPVMGTVALFVEGAADIGDGAAAAATETRSPLGAAYDHGTDLPRIALNFLTLAYKRILPKAVAGTLLAEKAATAIPSAIALRNGNKPVVGDEGKITAGVQRVVTGLFALSAAATRFGEDHPRYASKAKFVSKVAQVGGWVGTGVSVVTVIPAVKQYIEYARLPKRT